MEAPLLKASEVARMLNLTRNEIYLMARSGRLPSVHFGKRAVRFRPEDVDRFISDHLDYGAVAAAVGGGAA